MTPTVEDQTDEATTTTESEPQPIVLKGTVVRLNRPAGSFALATGDGEISGIHTRDMPTVGNKIEAKVRRLANGTYAEDGPRTRVGSAKSAKISGVVTYADGRAGVYTLSNAGTSLLVHAKSKQGSPADAPRVGEQLVVTATISDRKTGGGSEVDAPPQRRDGGCGADAPVSPRPPDQILTEVSRRTADGSVETAHVEGIVQGACIDARRLIISADDVRESAADVALAVPKDSAVDLSSWHVGDVVDASVTIGQTVGALTLTGISSDEGITGAEDADLQQGDQAG